ncbi:hypothetical protein EB796_009742 [Bugula neritina]|uniref:Uncharacterized protein n=1 Tax=Bugula neritina TaxID=10212 RepID=A0A7J7JZX9_BUGNE|nr:hypothetical protein EB796_009742 [Bugula neritina]
MLTSLDASLSEPHIKKPLGKRYGVRLRDSIVYKIIMCGGSNRGQTSFITRYTTGEFERTIPTIGSKLRYFI